MKTQIIQDHNGIPTGVFIPIEDWERIKELYPNIEHDNLPEIVNDNFSEEELNALAQSQKEDEEGVYVSSEEVHKQALNLCTK